MFDLTQALASYAPFDAHDACVQADMLSLLASGAPCFERTSNAHFTSSAWILSSDNRSAVLLFHRRFLRWVQPGGHADGEHDLCAVALREAREETALTSLSLASADVFDLDVFDVPTHAGRATRHFDVRWRFTADTHEIPRCNHEARWAAWMPLARLNVSLTDASVLRMRQKTR